MSQCLNICYKTKRDVVGYITLIESFKILHFSTGQLEISVMYFGE